MQPAELSTPKNLYLIPPSEFRIGVPVFGLVPFYPAGAKEWAGRLGSLRQGVPLRETGPRHGFQLPEVTSSIHIDRYPRDITRFIGGQEDHYGGHLFGRPQPPQGYGRKDFLLSFLAFRFP